MANSPLPGARADLLDESSRSTDGPSALSPHNAELSGRVQIAPPILAAMSRSGRNQARLAPLERTWILPATEAVGVRN